MPLNLYRRHRDHGQCSALHPPNTQTYESDELRRAWKKCVCPIYASGRLGANPKFRKNTKCCTWAEARAVAAQWETESAPGPALPPSAPPPPASGPVTFAEATEACLREYSPKRAAESTRERYTHILASLREFASGQKGYVYLSQWEPQDTRDLRASFRVAPSSVRCYMAAIHSFFEFCVENRWLAVNPAHLRVRRRFRTDREAEETKEKSPYTDAEISRMLAACPRYGKTAICGRKNHVTGEDLADFILISLYTGLRLSDVATFHISRLSPAGDVHVRALKNGGWVDTWVPEWLQEIIRARAARHGAYIFGPPRSTRNKIITVLWRQRLNRLWQLSGPWTEPATHHRFRHTFVRILLENGVSTTRVAELIGDTEAVVIRHYSKWVTSRQNELRSVLQQAFSSRHELFRVK